MMKKVTRYFPELDVDYLEEIQSLQNYLLSPIIT